MIVKEFCITNEHGLHARPASLLCNAASKYRSSIKVFCNGKEANAKSIVSVLVLEVYPGSTMKVYIEGPDEEEACVELARLIEFGFNE